MRFLASLLLILGLTMSGPLHAQRPQTPEPEVLIRPEDARRQQEAQTQAPSAQAVAPTLDPQNIWVLDLSTGGRVRILLRPDKAPNHVERYKTLTREGFYNGLLFHRVLDGFMAQTGDPQGTGQGGSKLPDMKAEFNDLPHLRGTVSAARTNEPDTANSQFFIMFQPLFRLDKTYTAFGRVIEGMSYVDAISRGEPPANPSRIVRAYIEADGPPPMPAAAAPAVSAPPLAYQPPADPAAIAAERREQAATPPR